MKEKVDPFPISDSSVIPYCGFTPNFLAYLLLWYSPIPVPDLLSIFVASKVEKSLNKFS